MTKKVKYTSPWLALIGMKVAAFRGYLNPGSKYGKKHVEMSFILFDDKKTYIELREQDPYDYHDYCNSARTIDLHTDAATWEKLFNLEGNTWVGEPTDDGYSL